MQRERLYKVVKDPSITIEIRSIPSRGTIHGREYYALAFKDSKPWGRVPLHQIKIFLYEGLIEVANGND